MLVNNNVFIKKLEPLRGTYRGPVGDGIAWFTSRTPPPSSVEANT